MRRWLTMTLVISSAYACGGRPAPATPPPERPTAERGTAGSAAEAPIRSPQLDGQIDRAALLPILDAGLGRFLQGVRTEAYLVDGAFVGFRLLSLWPDDPRFEDVGLHRGDVIVRINGEPIERPEQALMVWNGLRVASALYIEYIRDGQPRELRFAIVD